MHALAVGLAVGAGACLFYMLLGVAERVLLEGLAGYQPLRSAGEHVMDFPMPRRAFSPWMLALLPALGGLAAGFVAHRLAHETSGGGGDAYIDAFHRRGGIMRKRVALVKIIATSFTLGTGGSGGREGPTMQVGAAIGALVGRVIDVSARERRILAVSGTAAGLSAIFGTPLGAALFATEVLYRDDFESEALIPAILASVTAHSVFVAVVPRGDPLRARAPLSVPAEPPPAVCGPRRRHQRGCECLRLVPQDGEAPVQPSRRSGLGPSGHRRRDARRRRGRVDRPRQPAPRPCGARDRDPRERLRSRAGRDHRRHVDPRGMGRRRAPHAAGRDEDPRDVVHARLGRKRRRLRFVARARRPRRWGVRPGRAAPRVAGHRSRRVRARRDGHVLWRDCSHAGELARHGLRVGRYVPTSSRR